MSENLTIALKVVPVILLIALGVILEKTKFLNDDAIQGMKKMVMNISLPCLLFLTFLRAELKLDYLLISLVVFLACVISFVIGFLFKKLQKSSNQFYPAVFTSFVTGLLGYSLFISIFGTEQLYKLAVLDIGNLLFIFLVLFNFLDRVRCNQTDVVKMTMIEHLTKMVKSPLMTGMFLGIVISLLGGSSFFQTFPPTSALVTAVTMVANTTVPVILLVLGYELHFDWKHFVAPIYAVLLRITMMLILAYILNTFVLDKLFGLDKMFQMALYTMFVLPPTFIIPVFITGECKEKTFVLNFLSIHLIFSIIAFILLMTALR
jgi:hypothetical protein